MSVDDNNNRQTAAKLVSKELLELCKSDSLSEKGLREIIERHPHDHHVSDYQFFLWACINERVTERVIRCLFEYFPVAISAHHDGWSALHYACCNKNMTLNIVQLLIDAAPNSVRSISNSGRMPLHCLCYAKNGDEIAVVEMLKLLIEKHPEAIRHATNKGSLPIHLALRSKNVTLNIIQLLIDAAPDSIRSVDEDGDTPLHNLCMNEELDERAAMEILKLLIEKHPEAVRHANNDGDLPIHFAGSPEFSRILIEAYPGSERIAGHSGWLPFNSACYRGTFATVKYLYKIYPDAINHRTRDGYHPIHHAIVGVRHRIHPKAAVGVVKFLLDCDPSAKLQKVRGKSLLQLACSLEYVDLSIEAGVQVQVINTIYDAYPEAIEDNRISSNIDRWGQQVQSFISSQLAYSRQAKDIRLMTTPDDNGQLPLHTALQNDVRLGSIKLLVKGNPPALQSPDNNGALPLHMACRHHESSHVVRYLVGLDTTTLDAVDREGNTALHYACRGANYETIAMLVETYDAVSVSKRNAHGKLPINLLLESERVSDRESVEYTGSVFMLLTAYPEAIMNFNVTRQQANTASCSLQNGKKRKLG